MKEKNYNGWTNYETWLVALWIDNDKCYYDDTRRFIEETREAGETRRKNIVYELSKKIEDSLFDEMQEMARGTLIGDLAFSALREVNYYEIANHIVEEE